MNSRARPHKDLTRTYPTLPRQDMTPVLPDVTRDETAEGWNDTDRDGHRDRDWYERERPPHHE